MDILAPARRARRALGAAGGAGRNAALPRRLRLPVMAAVVVALLAPLLQPGTAQAAFAPPGNFYANIVDGDCVNVRNDSTTAGAWIQEYPCDGTGASDFYFAAIGHGNYEIIGEHSNLCITPNGSNLHDGTPLVQWYCVGAQSQLWKLILTTGPNDYGSYEILNPATSMCLSEPDANDWTILQIQTCDDPENGNPPYQIFDLENVLPV